MTYVEKRSQHLVSTGRAVHNSIKQAFHNQKDDGGELVKVEWWSPQTTVIKLDGKMYTVVVREVPGNEG